MEKCLEIRDKKNRKEKHVYLIKTAPQSTVKNLKNHRHLLSIRQKLCRLQEYGVSSSALSNWILKYSQVQVDENTVLTAQQMKAFQRRNAELEEENLILKKPLQSSRHTQAETKSDLSSFQATSDFHSLPGSECELEYLL